MEKAKRELFRIKKIVGLDNPCHLVEKLFDKLVVPFMLYCSERGDILCYCNDSAPYEYLHLKFIKEILSVSLK